MKYLFFIIISVVLFACSDSNLPRGILSQEKMELILWEQMKADAFTKEFISKDSSKDLVKENIQLQQKIFSKYKIDKDDFYKSYQYYLKHDGLMKDVLDSIVAKQTRIHQKDFEKRMSGKRTNDYDDIFKLKEILKAKTPFKMQDSLKFNKETIKPDFIKKIDSLKVIQSFKRMKRNREKLSLQEKEI